MAFVRRAKTKGKEIHKSTLRTQIFYDIFRSKGGNEVNLTVT